MYVVVYIHVCVHIRWASFLEVISLSIKGDVIQLHVDVAVLLIARPADRSAVERRPTANVILQQSHWLRLLIGHLDFRGLKGDKTRGLVKSSKGQSHSCGQKQHVHDQVTNNYQKVWLLCRIIFTNDKIS